MADSSDTDSPGYVFKFHLPPGIHGNAPLVPQSIKAPPAVVQPSSWEQVLGWHSAWTTAIALAWKSEDFKKRLMANPREVLKNDLGYDLPIYMELEVRDSKDLNPDSTWDWEKQELRMPNTVVRMVLPPAPEVEMQGIALSCYSSMGKTYPFSTCCC